MVEVFIVRVDEVDYRISIDFVARSEYTQLEMLAQLLKCII